MNNRITEADGANAGNPGDPFVAELPVMSPNDAEASPMYGSEVSAKPPRADMFAIDELAGGPAEDRRGNPADFTGGDLEKGAGGMAIGMEPGMTEAPGYEVGEAIGI